MIKITVFQCLEDYTGFRSEGHADYADEGYDIICSAISVLTVNCVNSIEEFTEDGMDVQIGDGLIEMMLDTPVSKEANLLIHSMVLGIESIQKNYGNEYIELIFKEV